MPASAIIPSAGTGQFRRLVLLNHPDYRFLFRSGRLPRRESSNQRAAEEDGVVPSPGRVSLDVPPGQNRRLKAREGIDAVVARRVPRLT
jgi:hypothetical protein